MSTPLTPEEREKYTLIIDNILAAADLQTVTRKKIRDELAETVNKNLDENKNAIKRLIEERFDHISAIPTPPSADAETSPQQNGHTPSDDAERDDDDDADDVKHSEPPKKRVKRESEDADARLAAELQAQENRLAQSRKTRGGGVGGSHAKTNKKAKAKSPKKKRAKSAKRVRDEDDSDIGSGSEAAGKEKRKAGGGFQKPFLLSEAMRELCGGELQLSRPQVVKKIWDHIKANELQDPQDKRQIQCDDKMQAVFKTSRVNMFSMNKAIGPHLYPVEEAAT